MPSNTCAAPINGKPEVAKTSADTKLPQACYNNNNNNI